MLQQLMEALMNTDEKVDHGLFFMKIYSRSNSQKIKFLEQNLTDTGC